MQCGFCTPGFLTRALHPVSLARAAGLQQDFAGELHMPFSVGAGAFNLSDVLACGLASVTVCPNRAKIWSERHIGISPGCI